MEKILQNQSGVEIWKRVPYFGGKYEVSNFGNIREVGKDWNYLLKSSKKGIKVTLCYKIQYQNIEKSYLVHFLVAHAFIPRAENEAAVIHSDRNIFNNHVSNLRWATYRELMDFEGGVIWGKSKINCYSPLGFVRGFGSVVEASRYFGVSSSCISSCLSGRQSTCVGMIWRRD